MIRVIKQTGQIVMDHETFMKTKKIAIHELNCGHYVIPAIIGYRHHQKTVCPYCKKKTFHTGIKFLQETK